MICLVGTGLPGRLLKTKNLDLSNVVNRSINDLVNMHYK